MKRCINCGVSNAKRDVFINENGQCVSCVVSHPLKEVIYVPKLSPYRERKNNPPAYKKGKIRKEKVCRFCGCGDSEQEKLVRFMKDGVECIYPLHFGCKKPKYERKGRIKKEKPPKPERVKRTPEYNLLHLPEYKVCKCCEKNLPIANFYLNVTNTPYSKCKSCFAEFVRKPYMAKKENIEKQKVYQKKYHKTYDRNKPRKKGKVFSVNK